MERPAPKGFGRYDRCKVSYLPRLKAAASVAPACFANAIGQTVKTRRTSKESSKNWKARGLAPVTSDGTDFLDTRYLSRQIGDWLWALEEVHCFGCSASHCRSFCFWHCSGIIKGVPLDACRPLANLALRRADCANKFEGRASLHALIASGNIGRWQLSAS